MTVSSRGVLTDVGLWLDHDISMKLGGLLNDERIVRALFRVSQLIDQDGPVPVGARQFELTPWRAFAYTAGRLRDEPERWAKGAEILLAAVLGTAYGAPNFCGPWCEVSHLPGPIGFEESAFLVRWDLGLQQASSAAAHLDRMRADGRAFKMADVARAAAVEVRGLVDMGGRVPGPLDPKRELERIRRALEGIG